MKKNLFFSVAVNPAAIPAACKGAFCTTNTRGTAFNALRFCPLIQSERLPVSIFL